MTITITNEETGRSHQFPSQEAFDDASAWATAAEKHTMLRFWTETGRAEAELMKDGAMVADWQEAIMAAWAAARAADTPLIVAAGLALWGERWQTEMSRALDVSDRTVRRWAAGDDQPRPGVYVDLMRIAYERQGDIEDVIERLKRAGA